MMIVNHYSKYFSLVQQGKFIKYLLVNGEEYYNITKYSSNSLQIYYYFNTNNLFFSFLIRRVLRQARRRVFDRIAKSLYPEEYAAHFIKSTKTLTEDSQKKIDIDCNSSIEDASGLEDASNDDSSSIESYGTLTLTLTITLS